MRRDEALRILAEHRTELTAMKVKQLRLFGSVARDEAGPDSDVDLLVDFERPVGYFHLFRVQTHREGLLGTRVDLGFEDALRPRLREGILREAVLVME